MLFNLGLGSFISRRAKVQLKLNRLLQASCTGSLTLGRPGLPWKTYLLKLSSIPDRKPKERLEAGNWFFLFPGSGKSLNAECLLTQIFWRVNKFQAATLSPAHIPQITWEWSAQEYLFVHKKWTSWSQHAQWLFWGLSGQCLKAGPADMSSPSPTNLALGLCVYENRPRTHSHPPPLCCQDRWPCFTEG